jgi:hypothetical protein
LREVLQIQTLRWQFDKKSPTREAHATSKSKSKSFCQLQRIVCLHKFQTERDGKSFCQQQTHLRGGIYAPQMEEFCRSKSPAVCRKTAGGAVSKGGSLWSAFLVRSFSDEKE